MRIAIKFTATHDTYCLLIAMYNLIDLIDFNRRKSPSSNNSSLLISWASLCPYQAVFIFKVHHRLCFQDKQCSSWHLQSLAFFFHLHCWCSIIFLPSIVNAEIIAVSPANAERANKQFLREIIKAISAHESSLNFYQNCCSQSNMLTENDLVGRSCFDSQNLLSWKAKVVHINQKSIN